MFQNFDKSLAAVLVHEGGFVNNPKDPGGMTNLGCTKTVWEEHCGHPVDEKAMRALTPNDVGPLYRQKYWNKICGDDLPAGVDYVVFDAAINSGPGRAAKWLQEAVGVTADGAIGKGTLAAVAAFDVQELIKAYSDKRLDFLQSLPTFETFGKGWTNRVASVQQTSSDLA